MYATFTKAKPKLGRAKPSPHAARALDVADLGHA